MGFALPKLSFAEPGPDGASLRDRFHAWWNGYELGAKPALRMQAEERPDSTSGEEATDSADPPAGTAPNEWSSCQRKVAQDLWTHGFIVPGGAAYVQELVGFCRLTAAETMLEIGVGMGGGTRAIIDKFGNYVTGFEENSELAAEARNQAITHDIADKLDVKSQPLSEIELKSSYFRAALMRDVLFTIEDKEAIIDRVCGSLKKEDSYLILTDLLFDSPDATPEVRQWADGERAPVYPWDIKSLKQAIETRGVMVRIAEDESERYCSMVTSAWSDYLKDLSGTKVSAEMRPIIAAEADFWTRRTAALESGGLKYYRVEGVRQG